MQEEEFLEKHIEKKILRYEQQLRGVQYHLGIQKMILNRIKNVQVPPKIRRLQQLDLFGT